MYSSYLMIRSVVLSFCRSDRARETRTFALGVVVRVHSLRIIMLDAELAETLVHLSLFAQLGVLIREYLCRFFVNGCDGTSWGPCRTCRNCSSGGGGWLSLDAGLLHVASLTHSSHARSLARSVGRSVGVVQGGVYFTVLPANMLVRTDCPRRSSLVARRPPRYLPLTTHHAPRTRAAFVPFVRGRL